MCCISDSRYDWCLPFTGENGTNFNYPSVSILTSHSKRNKTIDAIAYIPKIRASFLKRKSRDPDVR